MLDGGDSVVDGEEFEGFEFAVGRVLFGHVGFPVGWVDNVAIIARLFCILKYGWNWKSKAPRDWRHAELVARMLGDMGVVNLQFAR